MWNIAGGREKEREKGMQKSGGKQGSHSDGAKEIREALGSTVHTLDMTDGREMQLKSH